MAIILYGIGVKPPRNIAINPYWSKKSKNNSCLLRSINPLIESNKNSPRKYPTVPPKIENRVQLMTDLRNFFLSKCIRGIKITSGGIGKKILSINATADKKNCE